MCSILKVAAVKTMFRGGWDGIHRLPGTRMSPKPRSEKGRSQRARGEEFNLGTLSTIGSWKRQQKEVVDPVVGGRSGHGEQTHLFMRGGIRGTSRDLHHDTLPALEVGGTHQR